MAATLSSRRSSVAPGQPNSPATSSPTRHGVTSRHVPTPFYTFVAVAQLAGVQPPLPAARRRASRTSAERRLRAGREPHLELRSVAARLSRSGPQRQLHFMGKVELFNPVLGAAPARRRRVSGPPRRADLEAIETAVALCGRARSSPCSRRGPRRRKGSQEVRARGRAHGCGAHRARRRASRSSRRRSRARTSARLAQLRSPTATRSRSTTSPSRPARRATERRPTG